MNKVPKMISTKDLDYISDMLNWNLVYAKKAKQFQDDSENNDVQNFMKKVHDTSKTHYNFLLNILK